MFRAQCWSTARPCASFHGLGLHYLPLGSSTAGNSTSLGVILSWASISYYPSWVLVCLLPLFPRCPRMRALPHNDVVSLGGRALFLQTPLFLPSGLPPLPLSQSSCLLRVLLDPVGPCVAFSLVFPRSLLFVWIPLLTFLPHFHSPLGRSAVPCLCPSPLLLHVLFLSQRRALSLVHFSHQVPRPAYLVLSFVCRPALAAVLVPLRVLAPAKDGVGPSCPPRALSVVPDVLRVVAGSWPGLLVVSWACCASDTWVLAVSCALVGIAPPPASPC